MKSNKATTQDISNSTDIKHTHSLSAIELKQIINDFNPAATEYPRYKCIHQLFEEQVELSPNKIALEFKQESWTYKELNETSNQFARNLQAKGVKQNQFVAICVNRSPEMLIGLLAILKIGCAYIPLDPIYPKYRLEQIIQDARVKILITQDHLLDSIPKIDGKIIKIGSQEKIPVEFSRYNLSLPLNSESLAYLIYTSGSTGHPKGVQISHRAFVNFITSMAQEPGISPDDTLLAITTIAFDIAGLELFLPISTGAKLVIGSEQSIKDPFLLIQELERTGATIFQATPVAWRMLLEADWKGKKDLKALCGGEALPQDLAQKLVSRCASLWNLYGPTETTVWSSLKKIKKNSISQGYESIGSPIANTQIYILDSGMTPVPIGTEGELFIGGDGLSKGYFNKVELSNDKFLANPFRPGTKIYNTGDLARWLPDGNIEFLGRTDFQVKIRGFRIELFEIETCLLQFKDIKEAIVTTRDSQLNGKRLVAYIVSGKHLKTNITELRDYMQTKLPEYMIPNDFVFLRQFPHTPNGKTDRKALFQTELKNSKVTKNILVPLCHNPENRIKNKKYNRQDCKFEECDQFFCFCQTYKAYPKDKTLVDLFEEQVNRTPENTAIIFGDKKLTYRELDAQANQLAQYLRANYNVGPESLVSIMLERSERMLIAIYGILKAGGAYVPIDPHIPSDRIDFILKDTNSSLLITEKIWNDKIQQNLTDVLDLTIQWPKILEENPVKPENHLKANNLAYVIYTSGTTGRPKGVMNEHNAICNRLLWMQDEFRLKENERVLQKTPYNFDVSIWEIFWPLQIGACLVVAQPEGHKDSSYLVKTIEEHKVSTIHFVPSMLEVFLKEKDLNKCHSLKRIICSGEALSYKLQQNFFQILDIDLYNLYGPTEAAVDVTWWKCNPSYPLQKVPIGIPVANTQIYILDKNVKPVSTGESGELHIGGIQVARGYLNQPELTKEKFIPDPFSRKGGNKLYKTGDRVRYLQDGNIEFLNRMDTQVKLMGYRIELGEIEFNLLNHPKIKNSVVTISENSTKQLIAYILLAPNSNINTTELPAYLRKKIPEYMIPSQFITLKEMPLKTNGKIDRDKLPKPVGHRINKNNISPQNQMEEIIASIWSNVLKIEEPGINENFFEIGGNSLLIIRVAAQLKETIDSSIEVIKLFEFPTIQLLANYLNSKKENQPSIERITDRNQKKKEARRQRKKSFRTK